MHSIAVFMPFYFNYEHVVKKTLVDMDYDTYFINDNWDELSLVNHLTNVYFKERAKERKEKYYLEQIRKLPSRLETVLIITGRSMSKTLMDTLRHKYKDSNLIMYQWDGIAQAPQAEFIAKYCDRALTFDIEDSRKYGWIYRPLFFDNSHVRPSKQKYDLAYICSVHSERVKLFHLLKDECDRKHLNLFDYMYSDFGRYVRQRYIRHNNEFAISSKLLKFKKLPLDKTIEVYNETKCLVDYKFPSQTGLTMRTIESIGYKTKLLTNNKEIVNQDFYNPNNIFVYDIDRFEIPEGFLNTPYEDLDSRIYNRYSIQGWISDILGCDYEKS